MSATDERLRSDEFTVRRLATVSGGDVTTTVVSDRGVRWITFDATMHYGDEFAIVCMNLTEGETQELIRNLVASLNEYQRSGTPS